MISETVGRFKRNAADQLVQHEDRLRTSFEDQENNIRLNFEVAGLSVVHALASLAVTTVEILTPRSTE